MPSPSTPRPPLNRQGRLSFLTRKQGWFFFPLLFLVGLGLQIDSVRFIFRRAKVNHRWVELPILLVRLSVLPVLAFTFLPLGMAFAFVAVQLAVFGFYMGASFAPNHKGMPVLPADSRVDFLSRQVLTSRNISGGRFMDILLGGLNRQVEHHLFPDMARPQLHKATAIVRQYCATHRHPLHGDHADRILRHHRALPQRGGTRRRTALRVPHGDGHPALLTRKALSCSFPAQQLSTGLRPPPG